MRRRLALASLFMAALVVMPPHVQAEEPRCFPDIPTITNCIAGRFLQYWNDDAGEYTFGYPITAVQTEQNRDTKQYYPTQWFERNRFELHAENKPPYDVLLGRLGDERLVQLGRDWRAEGPEAGPQPGCRWFSETGHNVCLQGGSDEPGAGFLDIWLYGVFGSSRGTPPINIGYSTRLFGLPLTAARMETNADGDTVLTQWFERVRMEWHILPGGVGKVLFGRLGYEVLDNAPPPIARVPTVHERLNGKWANSFATITFDFDAGIWTALSKNGSTYLRLALISETDSVVTFSLTGTAVNLIGTAEFRSDGGILVGFNNTDPPMVFYRSG